MPKRKPADNTTTTNPKQARRAVRAATSVIDAAAEEAAAAATIQVPLPPPSSSSSSQPPLYHLVELSPVAQIPSLPLVIQEDIIWDAVPPLPYSLPPPPPPANVKFEYKAEPLGHVAARFVRHSATATVNLFISPIFTPFRPASNLTSEAELAKIASGDRIRELSVVSRSIILPIIGQRGGTAELELSAGSPLPITMHATGAKAIEQMARTVRLGCHLRIELAMCEQKTPVSLPPSPAGSLSTQALK
jgi:hypothetical protein